jgi:hypothetical protein
VRGRRLDRRLNIAGDAQGDLAGHGGKHRMEPATAWTIPIAREACDLLAKLPHARSYVQYSRPDATDRLAVDYDAAGRLTVTVLQ